MLSGVQPETLVRFTSCGYRNLNFIVSKKFRNVFRIVAAESFHDPLAARKFYLLGPGAGRQQTAKFLERQMKSGGFERVILYRRRMTFWTW